jgi:7,8-dihydropterin-6-yl-methyl-4-(beta-D-ribofuranosyl)aminobenzene 5'-phosphate synthase
MLVKALVENTSISKEYKNVHGLSLYIETDKHKLLFDLGPGKLFLENAKKLNIDIRDIDTVVISHGHYDHGGALKTFLENNDKAKIYFGENAFQPYYTNLLWFKYYIGLDRSLKSNERFVFTQDITEIDDELELFAGITSRKCVYEHKNNMFRKSGRHYIADTFEHEQCLLIRENDHTTLFCGCAHTGIVNVMERAQAVTNTDIDTVISGFHLYELSSGKREDQDYLKLLADTLKNYTAKFYTCHCTGTKIYDYLQGFMGDQLRYLSTGQSLYL